MAVILSAGESAAAAWTHVNTDSGDTCPWAKNYLLARGHHGHHGYHRGQARQHRVAGC